MTTTRRADLPRRFLLLLVVVIGVATGCATGDSPPSVGGVPPTGAPTGASSADGAMPQGYADLHCADPTSTVEPVDLVDVAVSRPSPARATGITTRFVLSRPLRLTTGVLELAIGLYDRSGAPRESLAVRFRDGHAHLLSYLPADGSETQLPGTPAVDGGTVIATFPLDPATVTRGPWQWRAVAEIDGSAVDSCPVG